MIMDRLNGLNELGLINGCQPVVSGCQVVVNGMPDGCQPVVNGKSEQKMELQKTVRIVKRSKTTDICKSYRPHKLSEVYGNESVLETLKNDFNSGDERSKVFLLSGKPGTGKTTIARILASGLNCENGDTTEPCLECSSCKEALKDQTFYIDEINCANASNKDDAQNILESLANTTISGRNHCLILDEFHQMTSAAQNVLLKPFEEPPGNTYIFVCSSEPDNIEAAMLTRMVEYKLDIPTREETIAIIQDVCSQEGWTHLEDTNNLDIFLHDNLGNSYREIILNIRKAKNTPEVIVNNLPPVLSKAEIEAEKFGKSKDIFTDFLADCEAIGLVGEDRNKLLLWIIATSRQLEDPAGAIIQGTSGDGKSEIVKSVLKFIPSDEVQKLSSITPKALGRQSIDFLKNRILFLEELIGAGTGKGDVTQIKLFFSQKYLESLITGKGIQRVEGPITFFTTTTSLLETDEEEELKSRLFVLPVDNSGEQTKKITKQQAWSQTPEWFAKQPERDAIVKKHHAFQQSLIPVEILTPESLVKEYADMRNRARRDFPKLLQLYKAIAFIQQNNRPHVNIAGKDCILLKQSDIDFGNELVKDIFGFEEDDLLAPARDLKKHIEKYLSTKPDKNFTFLEIQNFPKENGEKYAHATLKKYLDMLIKKEYVHRQKAMGVFYHRLG